MSDVDRAELRRLLDEATPGPWWHEWVDGDDWWAVYGQPTGDMVCPEVCTMGSSDEAAYIAAVNPAVVLGLVSEIERLTGEPSGSCRANRYWGRLICAWVSMWARAAEVVRGYFPRLTGSPASGQTLTG